MLLSENMIWRIPMIVCRVEKEQYDLLEGLALSSDIEQFRNNENIGALALIDGDYIVGTLIGSIVNGVYQVYWIYVEPESRRKGGGKMLVRTLREILDVLMIPIHAAWEGAWDTSEDICAFWESLDFTKEMNKEVRSYSVRISQIEPIKGFDKKSDKISTFEELGQDYLKKMQKDNAANEIRMIPEGGFLASDIRRDLSLVFIKENKPIAYIVFKEQGEILELSTLYSSAGSNAIISYLLYEAVNRLKEKCANNQILHINAVTEGIDELVKYFIPTADEISYSYYG